MTIKIRSVDAGEFQGFVQVDKDGNAVSSSNPLPITSSAQMSSSSANFDGVMFTAFTVVTAVAAKYTSAQLYNPIGSGKTLLVYSATGYNVSTACLWYRSNPTTQLANSVLNITNNKLGGANSIAQLRTDNLSTVPDTTLPPVNVTQSLPAGAGLLYGAQFFAIPEGYSLQFTQATVNVGMGVTFVYAEIAN